MAIRVNEQRMVDDNTFQYEEKIKSPTSRLIEQTPTFVQYFHINDLESTTDAGFRDVASLLGYRSPFRFDKIDNFPIYGLDQIVLQLNEEDQGFDTSYEGDAIILPSTIKPLQNDLFIIPFLKDSYIFRVIAIEYDNIMPDNFYKIQFKLEYLDQEWLDKLENQKQDEYECILENIGTESECIMEKSSFMQMKEVEKMYREICDFYKAMFYNERHNVFLAPLEKGHFLYDPLQTQFINSHKLFNERTDLETLILTDQYTDNKRKIKYARSMYRYIELRKKELLSNFRYMTKPGMVLHESSFYRWHDKMIDVLDIPEYITNDAPYIFSDEFKTAIECNVDTDSKYSEFIKKYLRKEDIKIKDIPLDLDEELLYMNNCIEVFFFVPVILYIIREVIKENTSKMNKKREA